MLIKPSHWMALPCFNPSALPTDTCVGRPCRPENTGTQTTVEKFDLIKACLLTTTKVRAGFGSPGGRRTR